MRPMPYREPAKKEDEDEELRFPVQRLYIAFIVGALLGSGVTWKVLRHQTPAAPEACHDIAIPIGGLFETSCPSGTSLKTVQAYPAAIFCMCDKR